MELGKLWKIAPLVIMSCGMATAAAAQVAEGSDRYRAFQHGYHMMGGGSHWGGFGMVLGPIFLILVVVGIVIGVIYLLTHFGAAGLGGGQPVHDRALAVLKERYAKGEIDSQEFAERKKHLTD